MQSTQIKIIWKPKFDNYWQTFWQIVLNANFSPFYKWIEIPQTPRFDSFLTWFNAITIHIFRDFQSPLSKTYNRWQKGLDLQDLDLQYKFLNWVQKIWGTYLPGFLITIQLFYPNQNPSISRPYCNNYLFLSIVWMNRLNVIYICICIQCFVSN